MPDLPRPWEIWLAHHTHVDIGYTEPQDVILLKHAEFIVQALDYCTAINACRPENASAGAMLTILQRGSKVMQSAGGKP